MRAVGQRSLLLVAVIGFGGALALAQQQACLPPPVLQQLPAGMNMFSDQQEADLGDAMAEHINPGGLKIIENDALSDYLRALGDRLVKHLPPTQMKFRFYLIEFPEANAFSIAGGRIYVSRKMVVMARSEDELAGIIGHELGHILTHQSAIYMTQRFREVLGVTQVGDRKDIFDKFHQYLENYRRRPSRGESEEKEQLSADQVGLFAIARTGYSAQAFIDVLDRMQETHGQTGSWFGGFFGTTKPEQRRLREVVKNMGSLPAGCADSRPASSAADYAKWQEDVLNYSATAGNEVLPGLVFKNTLKLPLRPDISSLRFSPDGKYLIAQDEGGIHLLSREPLAVLFYIPAPDAHVAEFTIDSQSVVFSSRSLRVETWSIPEQRRTSVHEVVLHEPCMQSLLSPDGNTLACLNQQHDLTLLDVATSAPLITRKDFFVPTFSEALFLLMRMFAGEESGDVEFIHMGFSPDSRYFLAAHFLKHLAFNIPDHREATLPGSIKDAIGYGFAFLGQDRIIGINGNTPSKSAILRFPTGERLDRVGLATSLRLRAVAHGEYLFVEPIKEDPLGLLDLKTGRIVVGFKHSAADVYDDIMVNERVNGEVALYTVGSKAARAAVTLPQARLGRLQASAVSSDLNWVAISNRSRGALWNVARNVRTQYTRGFTGAWFSEDQILHADFPKLEEMPRAVWTLSPFGGEATQSYKLEDISARQFGAFLMITSPHDKNPYRARGSTDVEVRDITSNRGLWSRQFGREPPTFVFNSDASTILMGWSAGDPGGREELQKFPDLKNQVNKEDHFLELVDLRTDAILGKLLVKTNKRSIRLEGSSSDSDWIVLSAEGNQVLTFSLSSGVEKGSYFGYSPVAAASAGLLVLERDAKEVDLYDLASQQLRRRYVFSDPVAVKRLSSDGKRLLVLTDSQTVYLLDTTAPP
jgi:WD40 repeat protein